MSDPQPEPPMTEKSAQLSKKHLEALEELSAANCTGFPGCKVNHFTIDEIAANIASQVQGEARLVPTRELERAQELVADAWLRVDPAARVDACANLDDLVGGWLSQSTAGEAK